MSDLRVDLSLIAPLDQSARRARELADLGADGVFTFEGGHDVFFPLVLAAREVDVDLMTNVTISFPRSPMHMANAAYDLQLLSRGRFRLGLGSQVRAHIEKRFGAQWSRPAARMREQVLATKAIFAAWQRESKLDFRGEFTTHTLMTPAFDPGPNPFGPPPILVGALGPKMTEISAEVADGILVMPFNSKRHFHERTLPAIEKGLATGRRTADEFTIIAEVIVAMGNDDAELAAAARGVKGLLSFYGSTPSYRPVLEVEGWADRQPVLNEMSKRGEWKAMGDVIDDQMLRTLGVYGSPEDCAGQIVDRFGSHADRVCCYFPGYPATDERVAELVAAIRKA